VGCFTFYLAGVLAGNMAEIVSILSHDVRRYASNGKAKGGNDDWRTPRRMFDNLNREHSFTIDAAATRENRLCARYFDIASDALAQSWQGESLFCNPPYSMISKFLKKAHEPDTGVFVVPARTQSGYWLNLVWTNPYCHEIRFLHRNVRFVPPPGVAQAVIGNRAPLPVAILVYRNTPRTAEHRITVCCADTLLPLTVVNRGGKGGRPTLYDAEQIDMVIQLFEKGGTIKEIAEATGIPRSTVGRITIRL